ADAQRNARIAIVDQNARPLQKAVTDIGQIAADLAHPGAVRLWRDLGDVDATRGQVDDEEHGEPRQPATGPDVDGEEIRRGQDVPLCFQELGPRRLPQPIRRGLHAVFAEDGGDRAAGDFVIQVRQRALDPRVAPPAVLGGYPHDQRSDLAHDRWPSGTTTRTAVEVL